MEWQKVAFVGVLLLVAYHWIPKYIQQLGVQEDVYNHQPGKCRYVEGLDSGSEDMQTLPDGKTFISSGMQEYYNRQVDSQGSIYLFDFAKHQEKPVPLNLKGLDPQEFTPHGISVYKNDKTGHITLFVVNHHLEGDRIEKFYFDNNTMSLIHKLTYVDSRLCTANDVTAIDEDTFYFTNYLFSTKDSLKTMEIYMLMHWGSIYVWETGRRPKLVVSKLKQPNGIITSYDKRYVYVAHEGDQELLVYQREQNNKLTLLSSHSLNTAIDNLHLSADGTELWVGSHAIFWKIYRQLRDPEYQAPSQVLRLDLENQVNVTRVTEMYADDGTTLKGSSVATFYQGRLLIGTVIHKALLCEVYSMDK